MTNNKILQTLDIENNCKGIFHKDKFIFDNLDSTLKEYSIAWKHTPMLEDKNMKYFYLFVKSNDISNFCPHPELYDACQQKIEAQLVAARTAKISLQNECFFNIMPEHQLIKWFKLREQSFNSAQKIVQEPDDYNILHMAHVLVENISRQKIIFNSKNNKIVYDIFGSATGRLTTKKGSLPILSLKKEERKLLEPNNDAFIELDLNAAEIRMLLGLSGKDQPAEDIHNWISKTIFSSALTRNEVKVKTFAWLYNFSSPKSKLDNFFSREIFRDFYSFEDEVIVTPYGRRLKVDERKAQNYLLQSTTSDQVLENAYKIQKMLKNKKSTVAFTLHDSIILDMAQEDAKMLKDIKNQFETTRWGSFVSTCKIGKNFGCLREVKI